MNWAPTLLFIDEIDAICGDRNRVEGEDKHRGMKIQLMQDTDGTILILIVAHHANPKISYNKNNFQGAYITA